MARFERNATSMDLPRIGSFVEFQRLRDFLASVGYTEANVCERLGLVGNESLDLVTLSADLCDRVSTPAALNTVIRLCLLGEFVAVADAESQFAGESWASMNALGLVCRDPQDPSRVYCSVALYPVDGLYIVSDRWKNPDRTPKQSFPDVVYPALTKSTREFLTFLPKGACEDFLELCAGSGIAALVASQRARHVWAADVAARSTHFAAFNAALNDADNVTVLQGNLYESVAGLTFDRIAAHPPYMPVLRPAEIYYDGGEDGEQLTRRIVEGLPRYLRPGGRLYCRTLGTDRLSGSFERRVRQWLAAEEGQFDVAFFVSKNLNPARFAIDSAVRKATGQNEVDQWKALFEKYQITEILTGTLIIQRAQASRPVFTLRRSLAAKTNSSATESALQWESEILQDQTGERLLAARPIACKALELTVRHRYRDGELAPHDFILSSNYPFLMDCKVQPWIGYLLIHCDGSKTIREHFEACQENGLIVKDMSPLDFGRLLGLLVSGGFLETDEFKWPAAIE
jgi:SAM-dependent methyltransferase